MSPQLSRLRVAALVASLSACSTKSDGPVLEFAFDGACTASTSATVGLAVPTSGLSFDPGVEQLGARFDGSGAALELSGVQGLDIADALTLELFVNPDDWTNPYGPGGGRECLVSHSSIFSLAIEPGDWKAQAQVTTQGQASAVRIAGGVVTPGVWNHLALVFDGATSRLVLNGEIVAQAATPGELAINPKLNLVVGTWFKQNNAFCGRMDDLRLWNRALSLDELRAHHAQLSVVAPKVSAAR